MSPESNIAAHFHGRAVEIDVDAPDGRLHLIPALDAFLPASHHVWGRPGKAGPRSHRAYVLTEDYSPAKHAVLRRVQRIEPARVELRGGAASRGQYTLMPSSRHDVDDEEYTWADIDQAESTPAVVSVEDLIRGIRLAGAVACIAPYWAAGQRQELCLALSGFFYRAISMARAITAEVKADMFCITQADAESILDVLMEVAGDDEGDRTRRQAVLRRTFKKGDAGDLLTGGKTLADLTGDAKLPGYLYTLLTDAPEIVEMDDFLARFAIWQGPAAVIDRDAIKAGRETVLMRRQEFTGSFGHIAVDVPKQKGGVTRVHLADAFWRMPNATRVQGLTFMPGGEDIIATPQGDKVNQWSGFLTPPYEGDVSADDVRPFLNYIEEVIADGEEERAAWVLAWLADIFQYPADKIGTALLLVGGGGGWKIHTWAPDYRKNNRPYALRGY